MYTPFSNESMYENQEKPKKTCWVIHEFTSREMLGDTRCAPQCCFSVNCHSDFNAPVPAGAPWFPIPKQTMGNLFQYGFPMGFAMVSQRIKLTSFRAQHLASERKRLSSSARVMSWCADDMMEIGDRFLQKIQQKSQCSEIVPSKRRQCPESPWILVVFTKPCPTQQPPKHRSL